MKKLIYDNKESYIIEESYIIDETDTHYICEPYSKHEGYQYFSKSNPDIEVKEA